MTSVVTITQSLKGHGILGTDVRDIHAQKDRWLAENRLSRSSRTVTLSATHRAR